MEQLRWYVTVMGVSAMLLGGGCRENETPDVSYERVDQMLRQMQVETLSCTVSVFKDENREAPEQTLHWWYSEPGVSRSEITAGGAEGPFVVKITDYRAMQTLCLYPRRKSATVFAMTPWPKELVPTDRGGVWLHGVKALVGRKGEFVGNKDIGGTKAAGFRVADEQKETILWVTSGTETRLLEVEYLHPDESGVRINSIMINTSLDSGVFSADVPEGYTIESDFRVSLENLNEEDLLAGLRFLAERGEGHFPADLQIALPSSESPREPVSADDAVRTTTRLSVFIGLHRGAFRYAGKGIRMGDKTAVVCWYKPKDAQCYRVVRGDLSVVDMAEAELPTVSGTREADGMSDAKP